VEIVQARLLQISGAFVGALGGVAYTYGELIPSFVYPLSFAIFGLVYTKFLWKLFNPNHNYDGDWWGYTEYQFVERQHDEDIPDLPIRKHHIVSFRQSPFEFRIVPSEGKGMNLWKSDSLTAYHEGYLIMAYSVTRSGSDKELPDVLGYERMTVMDRGFLGAPKTLKGNFYHAAQPDKDLYRGETKYFRGKPPEDIRKLMDNE